MRFSKIVSDSTKSPADEYFDNLCAVKNPRYNGQYIKFKTYGFAIGFPKGLWAKGENRWFELEPSNEYRSMYNSMIEAIELYFAIDNLHGSERDKKSRKRSAIQIVESLCKVSNPLLGNYSTILILFRSRMLLEVAPTFQALSKNSTIMQSF